jgi:translocator protein
MTMAWSLRFCFCLMAMLLDGTKAFSSLAQVTTRPSLVGVVAARTGNDDGRGHTRRTRHPALDSSSTTTRCGIDPAMKAVGQRQRRTVVVPRASFSSDNNDSPAPTSSTDKIDGAAIVKYAVAILVQLSLMGTVFYGLDRLVEQWAVVTTTTTTTTNAAVVPFAVNLVLFYVMALKSRVFNPLSNARPAPQTLEATDSAPAVPPPPKRNMPSWTPPGVIFPIMWLLIIGPIRAVSSSLIYAATGHYACLPLLALVFHLSVGDVWNTINNVERRYGVAVTGVILVWLSNAHAAYQYWQIDPLAGKLLAAVSIWLTIATALVVATWRINPDPATGAPEPLYPVKDRAATKFIWFS